METKQMSLMKPFSRTKNKTSLHSARYMTLILIFFLSCKESNKNKDGEISKNTAFIKRLDSLAEDVKQETLRTWNAYEALAWGHDNLLPLAKKHKDWYEQPLYISLIDAYSTLHVMGLEAEKKRIEDFVATNVSFDKDMYIKTFELNIRVLGGLLSMYEISKNPIFLEKAEDFGRRLIKAFDSPTGLPYYFVNLKTGETKGEIINLAEAGSYVFELGILSYYTQNPIYYQTGKKASKAIHAKRSSIGLYGRDINVETGEWTNTNSMVGAYADSHFEYLYKGYLLFKDPELKEMWDEAIGPIQEFIPQFKGDQLWYGTVDMNSGEDTNAVVTLWDAYFPALLCLADDVPRAEKAFNAWNYLWKKNGAVPRSYNFRNDSIVDPYYQLNPEVMESAYYLAHYTNGEVYLNRIKDYYDNLKKHCRTDIAYTSLESVVTKKKADELPTFFFAETMKYFYLAFGGNTAVNLDDYVFSTEAHPFKKSGFKMDKIQSGLGIYEGE